VELLPLRASFAPDEPPALEVRGAVAGAEVELRRLGRTVARVRLRAGQRTLRFPRQPEGGYGVDAGGRAATALDVLASPLRRPRYGFVSRFEPGRDGGPVAEHARRFHLNAVQFYDWMYRHADLLPPRDTFADAIGREVSLATVRRLAAAVRGAGALPLGYAAVYAVGRDELPRWQGALLHDAAGAPWTLGEDFLWIVDPADPGWLRHFGADLRRAVERVGFAGFHLDQYGGPQRAARADGRVVDLAEAFPLLIRSVRRALPGAALIFNNVNDFPTWTTARAPQDAVYIEVWEPHTGYAHLAGLVARARAAAPAKPVILAAYLSCFRDGAEARGVAAAQLATAAIASSGGFHLLHGEDGAVLTHPYYPDHHRLSTRARAALRPWQDFVVRHGDLLFDADAVDVTRAVAGGINEELVVEAPCPVSTDPEPGALWLRVVDTAHGRLLHLVDLSGQADAAWDAGKEPLQARRGVSVRLTPAGETHALAASPGAPRLAPLAVRHEGRRAVVRPPAFRGWQLLWLPDSRRRDS
jgi:dextranase